MDSVQDTRRKNWGWFYYDLVDQWGEVIKADGLAVMMVLIRHADNESGQCFPSTATIAKKTGLSRRHVVSTLQLLAQHGLISKTARSITTPEGTTSHQSNIYTLLPLPGVMHTVHKGTAPDAQGVMQAVQGGYAPDAHKQDPMNKTQKNESSAPAPQMPYPANPTSGATGDMDAWEAVGHATPKGTPVNKQPGRPPVLAVPKPSDDPMTAARWATVQATWTADGTKITDPRECAILFAALSGEAQVAVVMGAAHYVAGRDRADGYGMSLRRFIEQGNYEQWQTPEAPRLRVVRDNAPAPRKPVQATEIDSDILAAYSRPYPRSVTA